MQPPANLSTAGQPLPFARETFNSLALANLLEPLRDQRKHHVLDLGAACGRNVAFSSSFRSKIYVADLCETLARKPAAAPERNQSRPSLFERQLVIEDGVHFDIVLAWDVLNYLKPNALRDMFGELRRFCRPGTLLHALI